MLFDTPPVVLLSINVSEFFACIGLQSESKVVSMRPYSALLARSSIGELFRDARCLLLTMDCLLIASCIGGISEAMILRAIGFPLPRDDLSAWVEIIS